MHTAHGSPRLKQTPPHLLGAQRLLGGRLELPGAQQLARQPGPARRLKHGLGGGLGLGLLVGGGRGGTRVGLGLVLLKGDHQS